MNVLRFENDCLIENKTMDKIHFTVTLVVQ